MRAHLLLLGLVVATSPAIAQPEERGARVPFKTSGDHERPSPSERDWIRLATPTPTRFGSEYIVIGRDAGMFRALRVEAVSGIVIVRRIAVLTHASTWKVFNVRRRLDRGQPTLHVDLGASTRIAQIVVTTDRRVPGSYVIYGSPGRTAPVLISRR